MNKICTLASAALLVTSLMATTAMAATCPTELQRNADGYWMSSQAPGWKSHKKTAPGVTINAKNFGGVVYSPKRQRLACVYRTSDDKWLSLVSERHTGISINRKSMDKTGNKPAWKFSEKHGDYACGTPSVMKISGCEFNFSNGHSQPQHKR